LSPKDSLTEESVFFRLERAVVDVPVFDLAMGPFEDLLGDASPICNASKLSILTQLFSLLPLIRWPCRCRDPAYRKLA
jgi:hypothetical protein